MLNSLASAAGLARPKKKFHFDVTFTLERLLNCTYVAGLIFSKIRLVDGGTYKFTEQSKRWVKKRGTERLYVLVT